MFDVDVLKKWNMDSGLFGREHVEAVAGRTAGGLIGSLFGGMVEEMVRGRLSGLGLGKKEGGGILGLGILGKRKVLGGK